MQETCYILSVGVHEQLKNRINGGILCKVIEDTLSVTIFMDDMDFCVVYDNLHEKILFGSISVSVVSNDIENKYRKYLANKIERYYFKELKEES